MTVTPLDRFSVGIVLERRAADNPWIDHTWRIAEVIAGAPDGPCRLIGQGDGWARYFVGAATVELYRKATEGYKRNLSEPEPSIYLILQPDDEATDDAPPYAPFVATACPYEAESYDLGGDNLVGAVPMPPELIVRVQAFIESHHVDEPFVKRKQKRKDKVLDNG